MGNKLSLLRSNKVHSTRSGTCDSANEVSGDDTFSIDHEVRVPVDYPSKQRRPLSISLKSIGSFRIRKSKPNDRIRKTTSLQSAVSLRLNPDFEKLKNDFEQYKIEKESDIEMLSKQCEVTMNENRRLRGELKMLQTTCTKLKQERDRALMGEKDALERSSAIEADKDKIQRQFKLFRDTKANELQTLLKEKHQLETRLTKYINMHGTESDSNPHGPEILGEGGEIISQFNDVSNMIGGFDGDSTADISNHLVFKGVEHSLFGSENQEPYTNIKKGDWDAVVQNLVKSLNANILSIPANNIYRIYISATRDMEEDVEILLKKYFPPLVQQCEFEGRFLHVSFVSNEEWNTASERMFADSLSNRVELAEDSDIFICFLGSELESIIIEDVKIAAQRKHTMKYNIIGFNSDREQRTVKEDLGSDVWESLIANRRTSVINLDNSSGKVDMANDTFTLVEEVIKTFLSEQPDHSVIGNLMTSDEEDWCVGCGWDQYGDFEQQQAAKFHANENPIAINLQQHYIDQLNEHIACDGPVQPLLVTGPSGCGKSLLLSSWVQTQWADLADCCVLSHFVGAPTTFSADVTQILRRFTNLLLQQLPSVCNPSRLDEDFPKFLDRAISKYPKGILIIIDNADNIQDLNIYLKWLVDPLPVGCRVVISVGSDDYPKEWSSLPKLEISPLEEVEARELLSSLWVSDRIPVSSDLISGILEMFSSEAVKNPLFLTIVSRILSKCRSYQEMSTELARLQNITDLSGLYFVMIEEMEDTHGISYVRKMLLYVYFSRNGLSETEIFQLLSIPPLAWVSMLKEFTEKMFFTGFNGFLSYANRQVVAAVEKYYDIQENTELCNSVRETLIEYFRVKNIPGQVTFRVADELPWLLLKTEQLDELRQVINTMCIFVRLYRKGRCAELIGYWKVLKYDASKIGDCYYDFIKMMEKDQNFGPRVPLLYDILGKFLRDLGLLSQALRPLERSLEIRESSLDPDDPSIGQSFHQLGGLYTQWKKFSTAETMYKQALEIKENAYGPEHPSVARELEALALLYLLQEKATQAEPLRRRATQISQKWQREQSSSSSMQVLSRCAEEVFDISNTNNSADIGKLLNDLGVLFFIQNNYSIAKSFFIRALEMRKSIFGQDHPDVAQSLHNLAALYNDEKLFSEAENLYERSLTIRRNNFSVDNPSVQSTLRHLAGLYRKQGKYEEAEKLYREILEFREKSLGEQHPAVASAINNLAVLLCQMNRHEEALPQFERAVKIYEENVGIQHPRVSEILQNMAKLYLDAGEKEEAARLVKQALDQERTAYYPPDHLPRTMVQLRDTEQEIKVKDIGSRRSSFSSIARINNNR